MDRPLMVVAAQVAEGGVEQVVAAVGPIGVAVDAVGPRRQKRDAAQHGLARQLTRSVVGKPQEVLAGRLDFVCHVADGGRDGNSQLVHGIAQLHHFDAVHRGPLGSVHCGHGWPGSWRSR